LIIFFEFDFLKYVAFIVICICMLSILYYAQDILLYHPNAEEKFLYFFPKMKHEQLEEVYISTSDNITLHGYFYKHPNSWTHKLPTILYLHGNAGSVIDSVYFIFSDIMPLNVLSIDYRGYGRSEGHPYEEGLYLDAEAAIDFLLERDDIDKQRIIVYGHSLGAAVAINLATGAYRSHLAGLIIEGAFTNIRQTACYMFAFASWLIKILPAFCFRNKFDSISKISSLEIPALLLAGNEDSIIPPKMTHCLFQSIKSRCANVAVIDKFGHCDLMSSDEWRINVFNFLRNIF